MGHRYVKKISSDIRQAKSFKTLEKSPKYYVRNLNNLENSK